MDRQFNNLTNHTAFTHLQPPYRNRQRKTPGPGATGIEVKHVANPFITGFV